MRLLNLKKRSKNSKKLFNNLAKNLNEKIMSTPKKSTAPKAPELPTAVKDANKTSDIVKPDPIELAKQQDLEVEAKRIKEEQEANELQAIAAAEAARLEQEAENLKLSSANQMNVDQEAAAEAAAQYERDHFVFAQKDGEIKRFSKVTWAELSKSPSGYELVVEAPAEVRALKKED